RSPSRPTSGRPPSPRRPPRCSRASPGTAGAGGRPPAPPAPRTAAASASPRALRNARPGEPEDRPDDRGRLLLGQEVPTVGHGEALDPLAPRLPDAEHVGRLRRAALAPDDQRRR